MLRYSFLAGIPLLFLTSIAGFRECSRSKDWSKCLVPLGLLFLAFNAVAVGARVIKAPDEGPAPKR